MEQDKTTWLDMVRAFAPQNASVRVSLSDRPVEEGGRSARVRVLAFREDGTILIEEPGFRELGGRLRPQTSIDVLAVRNETRLIGRCRVLRHEKHALNDSVSVNACAISSPSRVSSGQLRDYYRVPVTAAFELDPVPLKLSPSDSAALARAAEAGLDPEMVHKARVVNLSGGGIGLALVLERKQFKVFGIDTRCIMYLDFPTMDRPFNITGRVVHAEKLETGDLYLGMAFVFDDPVVQKHTEDQLQRVSVWLQREILRRERQE